MCRRLILACLLVVTAGPAARAQVPFARDLIPTRLALARVGLERQFLAVVPLQLDERLLGMSVAGGMVFGQTDHGFLHAYDAESGRHLWTNRLGPRSARSRPVSVNSFGIYVTNVDKLYSIDRATGTTNWMTLLGAMPSSSTAADEDRVMVGLANGKLLAYELKTLDEKKKPVISTRPIDAWNWQTEGIIETRPVPAGKLVVFGSHDGKVYVTMSEEPTILYRIATGGPIGEGLGTFGTRLLLVPSSDRNLYAVDLFTAKVLWTFPSGSPIQQQPLVARDEVFVVNTSGQLTSVDPANGSPRWTTSTHGGRLVSVGGKRVYLQSTDADLFVVDRATGQTLADPRATRERIGLNLRPYEYGWTNRDNDRIYLATSSGMVLCLREVGQTTPLPLRDPKAPAFGTIPREGVSPSPAKPPEAAPAEEKAEEKVEPKEKAEPAEAAPEK